MHGRHVIRNRRYALYRGAEWNASFLWAIFRASVDDDTVGAKDFGVSFAAMVPKAGG